MLYIIATPIGNIEDTSLRVTKTLSSADVILCEDTRTFGSYYKRIQTLFNISPAKGQKFLSFHDRNEFQRISDVMKYLAQGLDVALVSESGMPTISDPGHDLIIQIIKSNIPFTVIPGPTAFVTASVLSGFPTDNLLFVGFLPKKKSAIVQKFKQLKMLSKSLSPLTVILYESPHRINKTLQTLSDVMPDAHVAICREMTKKFEEVARGKAKDLTERKFKGEITVVLELFKR